jgi:hypothetical protein
MRNCAVLLAVVLAIFCSRPTLAATDLTGTWAGDLKTDDGSTYPLTFHLKQEADKLTGTIDGPSEQPLTIDNGKVNGDKITFDVTYNGMVIHHEGTVDGDEIKVSSKTEGDQMPPMQFTLKRSTDQPK